MKQTQKIWLWVGLGLFLIPELLWSPTSNFVFEFFQSGGNTSPVRYNFFTDPNNVNALSALIFVQFLGLLFVLFILCSRSKKARNKLLIWTLIVITALLDILMLFIFGLSVSLRSIGF